MDRLKLRRQLDIRPQRDLNAVQSLNRTVFDNARRRSSWTMRCELMLCDSFRSRMKNHFATLRIDDDAIAGARAVIEIAQSDNGSQAQAARDDGHVRSPAA